MIFFSLLSFVYFALRNTFSSYLLWGWTGLIAIQTYMYGAMRTVAYVQVFSLLTLFMLLLGRDQEKAKFGVSPVAVLMILFGFHGVLSAFFAYPGLVRNWELCSNMLKTLLFCILMPMVVTRRYRFYAMLVTISIGVGFHGLVEGLKFVASGGGHRTLGNVKFGDNNHFALVLVMILPVLLHLFQYAKFRIARLGYGLVFLITCLAVISTSSRGALLTLIAIGFWVVAISRRKIRGLFLAVFVAFVIVNVAPASWFSRMDTLESVESVQADSSFMGRVIAWKRASAIALKNPVLGGGFHAGQDPWLYEYFLNDQGLLGFIETPPASYPAATHSIYFEVMGDLGFVGFILFVGIMLYAFVLRRQVRKISRKLGAGALWAEDCSDMLAASMIAYLVGGAALSVAYFDLPYIIVMLMQVLKSIVEAEARMASIYRIHDNPHMQMG